MALDPTPAPERPPMTDDEAAIEAHRLLREAYRDETGTGGVPTSWRDTTPVPAVGAAAPVPQPDTRRVPQWATGTAVASIGIGAGMTGIGCGAWLVLHGLSAITLAGVLAMAAPFAGAAVVAVAVGAAASQVRRSTAPPAPTHVYQGPVTQETTITSRTRGWWSSTHIH